MAVSHTFVIVKAAKSKRGMWSRSMLLTNFGEGNELAPGSAGLVDEVDGLSDAALKVEPSRLGGDLS